MIRCLTVAGSDSSGGAGIQADLKTFMAFGAYGASAVTAVVAEDTSAVHRILPMPGDLVAEQMESAIRDMGIRGVKIGMLPTREVVLAVARVLEARRPGPVVLDPVVTASAGVDLVTRDAVDEMVARLFPLVDLLTPNLGEAGLLLGREVSGLQDAEAAARDLVDMGCAAVLVKGGHLPGQHRGTDLLATRGGRQATFPGNAISPKGSHGTGCALSSAICVNLAAGTTLETAVATARRYVREAMAHGPGVGRGQGVLDFLGGRPAPWSTGEAHSPSRLRR